MMKSEPSAECRSVRIYRWLLAIHPLEHRREYGGLMTQLFRDQCRAAGRSGKPGALFDLWRLTLSDLAASVVREHFDQTINQMKKMPPTKVSMILAAVAILAAALTGTFVAQPGLALALAYFSLLAVVVRAIVEWFRPDGELLKGLAWAFALLVAFGFICPLWAKIHLPLLPALIMIPICLTLIVPVMKAGLTLARWRS
jgi:hypothetical protein